MTEIGLLILQLINVPYVTAGAFSDLVKGLFGEGCQLVHHRSCVLGLLQLVGLNLELAFLLLYLRPSPDAALAFLRQSFPRPQCQETSKLIWKTLFALEIKLCGEYHSFLDISQNLRSFEL